MIMNPADYLQKNARLYPEKVAVVCSKGATSYAALNRNAGSVAAWLRNQGIGPGDRVGILLSRSADAVAAIFGILRTGAAYVPMDIDTPDVRIRYISDKCGLKYILTEQQRIASASASEIPVNLMISVRICLEYCSDADKMGIIPFEAESIVYILFTSGSTGVPKGVAVSHGAAHAFLDWSFNEFNLSRSDNFAAFASFNFDLSVFDIFNSIRAGGTLHLISHGMCMLPKKLASYLSEHHITVWYSVPWVLTSLVRFGRLKRFDRLPLRLILFAGEVFPIHDLKLLVEAIPEPVYCNLFGPTETNVCTAYQLPESILEFQKPVPIGVPVSGDRAYIVDELGRVITGETPGELLIAGDSVMSGYWEEPEMTAAVFTDEIIGIGPGRFYRTGDRVSRDPAGNLIYHGRMDNMIKRRGYRIEPGEIEHAAAQHQCVDHAVVICQHSPSGNVIHLIISPDPGILPVDFKNFLSEKIPVYMVPDVISYLSIMPRNPNGKIDRKKLKESIL